MAEDYGRGVESQKSEVHCDNNLWVASQVTQPTSVNNHACLHCSRFKITKMSELFILQQVSSLDPAHVNWCKYWDQVNRYKKGHRWWPHDGKWLPRLSREMHDQLTISLIIHTINDWAKQVSKSQRTAPAAELLRGLYLASGPHVQDHSPAP